MQPALNDLFGFRLLGYEPSLVQPKAGNEPPNLSQVMDTWGIDGAISRISTKMGAEPQVGHEPLV